MKKFKRWLVELLIGNYYTEKEVIRLLSKMQYEMAQQIIGNRPGGDPVVPLEFWQEENGKYNTNLFISKE